MDGVERVMVLGILAVIVAILSFAWGATGDGVLAHDGVTDGGTLSSGVPLSSVTSAVVTHDMIDDPGGARGDRVDFVSTLPGGHSLELEQQGSPPVPFRTRAGQVRPGELGRSSPQRRDGARSIMGIHPGRNTAASRVTPVVPDGQLIDPSAVIPPQLKLGQRLDRPQAPNTKTYTVQPGDTLWQIAYREVAQGGDTGRIVDLIQELNPTIDASDMQIGQSIQLPVELPEGAASKDLTRLASEHSASVYTITAGDTLRSIARAKLGEAGRWKEIYRLNPNTIREPSEIRVGLRILVPQR